MVAESIFTVYILRTSAGTLYVGQTNNLERRLKEHKSKTKRTAKYIRCFDSCDLVYKEEYLTRGDAMRREIELKKFTKKKKEKLIECVMETRQQVAVIHGGTTFEQYDDFIDYLKNSEIYLDRLRFKKDWKENLQDDLGNDFDVLLLNMPNKMNAKYLEWAIYFEKVVSALDDDLILIGKSLGGIFLAKYLSENYLSKKIKAIILVAAPYDEEKSDELLGDFNLLFPLSKLNEQCKNIYLIQSKDDDVVLFEQAMKYKRELPESKLITFNDRGHFSQEFFPEIVNIIKEIKASN